MFSSADFTYVINRLTVSASLILMCLPILSWAAPAVPDAADIPRPQPTLPPQPRPAEIKQQERPAYRPSTGAESVKVQVEQFIFSGNQVFSTEQLRGLVKDYLGRENDINALNRAAKIITDYYRNNGYFLAQAYLPAQDIRNNTVEIAVLEGTLGEFGLNGAEKLNGDFLGKMAAYHLKMGDAVAEKNLVRNVTLLNSLPAIRASAQLNPGETVGSSNVDIELQPLPAVEGHIAANTYGNRFTGREVLLAGLRLNNLAGRGDQLSLGLKNSRDDGQRGLNLGYLMPVHESGTLLSLSYNYVDYKLGGPFKQLKASGDSQYFSAGLDQPLMRNAQGGLSAHMGGTYKLVDDDVSAFSLNNRRNISNRVLGS
jgi:hemolysin activation/secretion protein